MTEAAEVADAITQESTAVKRHEAEQQIPDLIYRVRHSDTWACKNCRQKGDKWFMQQYVCGGRI